MYSTKSVPNILNICDAFPCERKEMLKLNACVGCCLIAPPVHSNPENDCGALSGG